MGAGAVGGYAEFRLGESGRGFLLALYTFAFVNFSITRPIMPLVAPISPPHLGKNSLTSTFHRTPSPAVLANFPISAYSS
jgi:hypothetical protein